MHAAIEAVIWVPSWFLLAASWFLIATLTIGER